MDFHQCHIGRKVDLELRALAAASIEYPRAPRRLLVLTRDEARSIDVPGVVVAPTYEWLLEGAAEV